MRDFKVTLKPQKNGSIQIRLQGIDDTGRVLSSWVVAPDRNSVASVTQDAIRSMQALAANVTEEESSDDTETKA